MGDWKLDFIPYTQHADFSSIDDPSALEKWFVNMRAVQRFSAHHGGTRLILIHGATIFAKEPPSHFFGRATPSHPLN